MAQSPFVAPAIINTITQGSIWAVLVQPSFPDLVFEAAALVTKGAPSQANPATGTKSSYQPSEFALGIKDAAQAINGTADKDPENEENEEFTNEDLNGNRELETEETKQAKRKIVEEIWSQLKPSCFARADDRELEAATNLLLTLMFSFFLPNHPNFSKLVIQLLEAIATAEGKTTPYGRYNALFTLFNALPAPMPDNKGSPPLQLSILSRLADMVLAHPEDLSILLPSLLRLPSYLTQWNLVDSSVGVATIEKVITVCEQAGKLEDAFNLSIVYLSSPTLNQENENSPEVASVAALAVKIALTLPNCYDWDLLEDIRPVNNFLNSNIEGEQTYKNLMHLLKSPSTHFKQIEQELEANIHLKNALSKESILLVQRKARLLCLTDLCGDRVGGEVHYSEVKDCLGLTVPIEEDDGIEVEEWVINAIKANLITARLHQPSQVIYVTKAAYRTFSSQQWINLQNKLKSWGKSIDHLIDVVDQGLSQIESSTNIGSKGNFNPVSANA